MNDNILEPKINGLPPVTDWEKALILVQQVLESGFRQASTKELAKVILGDKAIESSGLMEMPVASSALVKPATANFYTILGPGTYTQVGQPDIVVASDEIRAGYYDGTKWIKKWVVKMPMQDISSLLKKDEVGNYLPDFKPYILLDTIVSTNGTVITHATQYAGAKSIVRMPFTVGVWTIGGYLPNSSKNFALSNAAGQVKPGSIQTLASSQVTFVIENDGYNLVSVLFKQITTVESTDSGWINSMTIASGGDYVPQSVSKVLDKPIYGAGLIADNKTPLPLQDYNAVNLLYLKMFGLLTADLTVTPSKNLAIQETNITVIPHKFIGNNGNINAGMYWYMYKFYPLRNGLKPGDPFLIHGFTINTAGYSAWYEGSSLKNYNGSYQNSDLPKPFIVPVDATLETILYFDLARPIDVDNFKNLVINYGTSPIPYENPYGTITKIKGRNIGGGNSNVAKFSDLTDVPKYNGNKHKVPSVNSAEDGLEYVDPVLENTDVNFNKIKSGLGEFDMLVVNNVPIWDETGIPPVGKGFDYLVLDGNGNYFKKTKG